jgi:hypothetical protein
MVASKHIRTPNTPPIGYMLWDRRATRVDEGGDTDMAVDAFGKQREGRWRCEREDGGVYTRTLVL